MSNNYQQPSYLRKKGKSNDIFLLIVEGRNTEKIYFEKLKGLRGRSSNIRIKIESSDGGDIEKMLKEARQQIIESKNKKDLRNVPFKKVYIVIDRDRFANTINSGIGLQYLKEGVASITPKEPIEIILSAPSFEYWYLLHFCDKKPSDSNKVIEILEGYLRHNNIINVQQSYSKNGVETRKMLDKFLEITDVVKAICNATKIANQYEDDKDDRFDREPYTEVHNLIKNLGLDKTNE